MGRGVRYNKAIKEKKRSFFVMTLFLIVSAIVLISVLWDSTEDIRKDLLKELDS